MNRDDIPTAPMVYPPWADTMSPEDYYTTTTRGLLDDEFACDTPRESVGVIRACLLLAAVAACWVGIVWGMLP